jgi:hypothetical protein
MLDFLLAGQPPVTEIHWSSLVSLLITFAIMMGFMGGFIWISYFTASEVGKKEGRFARFIQLVIAVLGIMILLLFPLLSLANVLGACGLGDFIKAHPRPTPAEFKLLVMSWTPLAIFHTVVGGLQLLILLPPFRWLLQKTIFPRIDSTRRVHTIALMFWVTAVSVLLFTVMFAYDPGAYLDLFKMLPMIVMAPAQTVLFILFCPLAIGFLIKRNWRETVDRLGIRAVPWRKIPLLIGLALVGVVAVLIVQPLLVPYTDPEAIKVAEAMSEALIGNKPIQDILLLGAVVSISAGVGEELIFRGLLQPVLGWFAANILFTVMHCHYGLSPLMGLLFVVALLFVWVRQKYGTLAAIITHTSFDFIMICVELGMKLFAA